MADDSERRVREAIAEVLDAFGVQYEIVNRKRHNAFQFTVGGKNLLFTYAPGDPRAHLNARSDVRNILMQAGLSPIETPPSTKEEAPKPLNGTAYTALDSVQSVEQEVVPQDDAEPEPAPMSDDETKPPPAPTGEPSEPIGTARLNFHDSYAIYQSRLTPGKSLVVELDRDLLVQAGGVLVIPLHKPNTVIDLTRAQFDVLFEAVPAKDLELPKESVRPVVSVPPVVETASEPEVPPPLVRRPINTTPITRKEQVGPIWKPSPSAPPSPDEPVVVQRYPESARGGGNGKNKRATNFTPNPNRTGPRSIDGVSPQLGRILAGMAHVSEIKHRSDLEPSMLDGVLAEHDRHQYAARLIKAIDLGLVERGLPLPGRIGYHNKLTTKGHSVIKKLGKWSWNYDGLEVPKWVK